MSARWQELRLGDLGQVYTGRTPPTERLEYYGDDFPFITPGDMRQGKYALTTERSLSPEGAELLQRICLPPNSVCVSCIGWQMGEVIMTNRPSFTNQQINTIVPDEHVDADFLYYAMKPRKQELLALGASTGVRTPILNKSAFCKLKILLPPITLQRKIAGILSAYDELIANNQRRIAVLEQMARALYREWFVYFRAPGVVMIAGEELPEGWEVQKLGAIADIRKGLSYKGEFLDDVDGKPMVNLKCITPGGGFRRDGVKGYTGPFKEHQAVRPGDIVFANTDLTQAGFIIGSAAIVPRLGFEDGGLATHHICIAHEKAGVASKCFLYFTLNDERFREFARGRASGTTVLGFRTSDAEDFEVQLPPTQMMERFTAVVQPILDLIETLAEKTASLRRTRDLLLPRLMSGRVEIMNP